jgi:hypothetical protein
MIFSLSTDSECVVQFEPEGSEHLLGPDDEFRVELSGKPNNFEITHDPQRLSIWIDGCEVRAWNKAGVELRL